MKKKLTFLILRFCFVIRFKDAISFYIRLYKMVIDIPKEFRLEINDIDYKQRIISKNKNKDLKSKYSYTDEPISNETEKKSSPSIKKDKTISLNETKAKKQV